MRIRRVLAQGFAGALLFAAGVYCGMCFNNAPVKPHAERKVIEGRRCWFPGCPRPVPENVPMLHCIGGCVVHKSIGYNVRAHARMCKLRDAGKLTSEEALLCLAMLQRVDNMVLRLEKKEEAARLFDLIFPYAISLLENCTHVDIMEVRVPGDLRGDQP